MTKRYDVLGVGFGPANLALAVALDEAQAAGGGLEHLFLERQKAFGWHRGMLIDDATLQVSFLKDVVTMRNPTSPYTFISYLHSRGRLAQFINAKMATPLRIEFEDYLRWVADNFKERTQYGTEVTRIEPVGDGYRVEARVRDVGATRTYHARTVVIGTGLTPRLPDGVRPTPRIWHSSELLDRFAGLAAHQPRAVVVVGAGQSAAEAAMLCYEKLPVADIHLVFRGYGYRLADDSPFANRIFDPDGVDTFYQARPEVQRQALAYHAGTNYSVVDGNLAERLFRTDYRDAVRGCRRLFVHNLSELRGVRDDGVHAHAVVEHLSGGNRHELTADAVILATGYRPSDPTELLTGMRGELAEGPFGRLSVGRDFQVRLARPGPSGLFVHGPYVEPSHGLSAGLLSTVAVRAGELLAALESDPRRRC